MLELIHAGTKTVEVKKNNASGTNTMIKFIISGTTNAMMTCDGLLQLTMAYKRHNEIDYHWRQQ